MVHHLTRSLSPLGHTQVIVKKGEKDLPGLTDEEKPRMRGPKRASKVGGRFFHGFRVQETGRNGHKPVYHALALHRQRQQPQGPRLRALYILPCAWACSWRLTVLPCLCSCSPPLQIRKLFNLTKDDDVRKYVNTYRRTFEANGKKHSKAPKIQRLVTPETLQVCGAGFGQGCCVWGGSVLLFGGGVLRS